MFCIKMGGNVGWFVFCGIFLCFGLVLGCYLGEVFFCLSVFLVLGCYEFPEVGWGNYFSSRGYILL